MAEISIGSVLGGYRIEAVAGEGGMGRVYRATQMGLSRKVALKVIMPELATEPDFRERFARESRLTAAIEHPNVIPVYEAGEADGRLFIVMRWVEGTDMRSVIVLEGRLAPERAVGIVEQVAAALDAAHRGGLVHRDVKPANVMLTTAHGEEHVYLTDFGLTKQAGTGPALTRTGAFVGTPDYMPPEQIKGERADARTDVYALGCLLFHALTGHPPYDRDTEVAKMYAQLHDPPPSVVASLPGAPAGLDAVVERALAKDPDGRYPSAGDLGRAARAALSGADASQPERSLATGLAAPPTELAEAATPPTEVTPTPPTEVTPPPAELPPPTPPPPAFPPGAPSPPPQRRGVLPLAFGGVLLLGVVVALLAVTGVLSGDDKPSGSGSFSDQADKAKGPEVVATIRAGDGPDGIAVDGDSVWVSNSRGGTLTRLSTKTNKRVGRPITVGTNPDEVEAANGVVWVANTGDGSVTRVEGNKLTPFTVGLGPEGLSLGGGFLWVANGDSDSVSRIDLASGTVEPAIAVQNKPVGIYAGKSSVWVTNSFSGSVSRLDRSTETLTTIEDVGKNIRSVTEAFGSVWVSAAINDGYVTRLDPASGKVLGRIFVGDKPKEMVRLGSYLWVVNETSGDVMRIDPKTRKVVGQPIDVGKTPVGLATGAGDLWVTNNGDNTVSRIDPG
jgi:YVTN family beta-propeller protein